MCLATASRASMPLAVGQERQSEDPDLSQICKA